MRPGLFSQAEIIQCHFDEIISAGEKAKDLFAYFHISVIGICCVDSEGTFHSPIVQTFQFIDEDGLFIIRPVSVVFIILHYQDRSHCIYNENSDNLLFKVFRTVFGAVHNKIGAHSLGPRFFSQVHLFQSESIELAVLVISNKHQNHGDYFHLPVAYVISTY